MLTIGRNNFSPRETTIKRWQVADTLTWVRGAHKLKGGFDFQFDDILNFFPGNSSAARYTFNSLPSFQVGTPNGAGERYLQAFAGAGTTGADDHIPTSRSTRSSCRTSGARAPTLTSTLGLRYDLQKFAKPPVRNPDAQLAAAGIDTSTLNTDTQQLGAAHRHRLEPRRQESRASAAATGSSTAARRRSWWAPRTRTTASTSQTITFTGALVPTYPQTFATIPAGGHAAAGRRSSIFDKDYQNPRRPAGEPRRRV